MNEVFGEKARTWQDLNRDVPNWIRGMLVGAIRGTEVDLRVVVPRTATQHTGDAAAVPVSIRRTLVGAAAWMKSRIFHFKKIFRRFAASRG